MTAAAFVSAGLRSPLGPRGILTLLPARLCACAVKFLPNKTTIEKSSCVFQFFSMAQLKLYVAPSGKATRLGQLPRPPHYVFVKVSFVHMYAHATLAPAWR
jgi:hypothetical protein